MVCSTGHRWPWTPRGEVAIYGPWTPRTEVGVQRAERGCQFISDMALTEIDPHLQSSRGPRDSRLRHRGQVPVLCEADTHLILCEGLLLVS